MLKRNCSLGSPPFAIGLTQDSNINVRYWEMPGIILIDKVIAHKGIQLKFCHDNYNWREI